MTKKLLLMSTFIGLSLLANSASAGLIYGFEDGQLQSGQTLTFSDDNSANRQKSGDVSSIYATEGDRFFYMTTGPNPEDGTATTVVSGSKDKAWMNFSFEGQANSILFLDYDVLTSEISALSPDFFKITLDGIDILNGAIGFGSFIAGNFTKPLGMGVDGLHAPDGSRFVDGHTGWRTLSSTLGSSSNHTLSFFVEDAVYENKDTALLIDNIRLTDPNPTAPVPEPATMILLGTGLAGLAAVRRRCKKEVC